MKNLSGFIITLVFIGIHAFSYSQTVFDKVYCTEPSGAFVRKMPDGNFLLLSSHENDSAHLRDILLLKVKPDGDTLWTKLIGGPDNEYAYDINISSDGGFIIAGGIDSLGDNLNNLLLVKTDSAGSIIWQKRYKVANHFGGRVYSASAFETYDGGILAGMTSHGLSQQQVPLLFKTNAFGDTLWTVRVASNWNSIKQTADSGFVVVNTFTPGNVFTNQFIRIDKNGSHLFQNHYFTAFDNNELRCINYTNDGGYILSGRVYNTGGQANPWLIKTNPIGDTLWSFIYDTIAGDGIDIFDFVIQTSDHGYIASGENTIVKTDSLGHPLWAKRYNEGTVSTKISNIELTADGGCLISGISEDTAFGNYKLFLISADSMGNSGCSAAITPPSTLFSLPAYATFGGNFFGAAPFADMNLTFSSSSGNPAISIYNNCVSAEIQNLNISSSITIYPNPSSGIFYVDLSPEIKNAAIEIYSGNGTLVYSGKVQHSKNRIDLSGVPCGIYLIKISDGNSVFSGKIMLQ